IDTTVAQLKSGAKIRQMEEYGMTSYRIDSTNDRLTCPSCRSMDGRIFKVSDGAYLLNQIENMTDFKDMDKIKPILKAPHNGKSSDIRNKFPPFHPRCHCRMVAQFDDESMKSTVE